MPSKTLLVFCDGTSMDGLLAEPSANAALEAADSSEIVFEKPGDPDGAKGNVLQEFSRGSVNTQFATNVLRLSRAVHQRTKDGRRQIVFYQNGVGAESDFNGNQNIISQALGTAVASKIRDAYAFIAQNYEEGDEICIFGFSRGAYTARKVAGLIDVIGLLTRESLGLFFTIWRALVNGQEPDIPSDVRRVRIKCVGVWDTVGSVFNTSDALSIKDTSLPPIIDVALHALSLQENRQRFLPTLWTAPIGGLRQKQVFKQVWFPGDHSDVGGGYERHELADLAVFWMAGEIESFVHLDLHFLQRSGQQKPDPWGTSQPHNAYQELPTRALRRIMGHETRLESEQIVKDSVFHSSIQVAPVDLKDPKYMITLDTIKKAFGANFKPIYSSLNSFEQRCKDQWGKTPYSFPSAPSEAPVFEYPGELFGASM